MPEAKGANDINRRKKMIEVIAAGFEWPERVLAMMRRSNNSRFKGKLYEYQLAMVAYLLELVYGLAIGRDFNVSRAPSFEAAMAAKLNLWLQLLIGCSRASGFVYWLLTGVEVVHLMICCTSTFPSGLINQLANQQQAATTTSPLGHRFGGGRGGRQTLRTVRSASVINYASFRVLVRTTTPRETEGLRLPHFLRVCLKVGLKKAEFSVFKC